MEHVESFDDRVEFINKSLSPEEILGIFNKSLAKKYPQDIQKQNAYSVFEIHDLTGAMKSTGFRYMDEDFISHIKSSDITNRHDFLDSVIKYLPTSKEYAEANPGKSIKPGSQQAKLRRTAAILYKSLIVPDQIIQNGKYKSVQMPIGVDDKLRNLEVDKIIRRAGPLWQWGGNFTTHPDQEIDMHKKDINKTQLVMVGERFSLIDRDLSIYRESEFVRELSKKLNNPTFLPVIRQNLQNSYYAELLPNEYNHRSLNECFLAATKLTKAVEELWKKGGVINIDLKPSNIKERSNGDLVLFDWGLRVILNPAQEKIPSDEINGGSSTFFPPEAVKPVWGTADDVDIATEPFLVYQIGTTLLADIFPIKEINSVLREMKGYRWNMPERADEGMEDALSITTETYAALRESCPEIAIPEEIDILIAAMISESPAKRPSLETIKDTLSRNLELT